MGIKNILFSLLFFSPLAHAINMKPAIKELIASTSIQDVRVRINEIKVINVGQNDTPWTLWTAALTGCTALAIVATTPNGKRVGLLTHLLSHKTQQEDAISLKRALIPLACQKYQKTDALIITPAHGNPCNEIPEFPELLDSIEMLVATTFSNTSFKTQYYDPLQGDFYNAIIVRIPGTRLNQSPIYQSWLSEGTF